MVTEILHREEGFVDMSDEHKETKSAGQNFRDQVKRTDQPYNTQPRSSVAGPFPLPDVISAKGAQWVPR